MTAASSIDPPDHADWHPRLQMLFARWRGLAPAAGLSPGLLPGRQHVGPEILKPWLPNIWLLDVVQDEIDVEGNSPRFRYRLAGTKLVDMRGGHNPVGQWLDLSNPARVTPNPTLARIRAVLETHQPSWRHGLPNNSRIDDIKTIENLFLPLAADGRSVDMLLCCSLYFGIGAKEI